MQRFIARPFMFIALLGLLSLLCTAVIYAQGNSQPPSDKQSAQQPQPQKNVSDEELQAFVKAYVEVQQIKGSHQTSLEKAQNPEQILKLQQETDSEMAEVLEKQGFTPEAYSQLLAAINSDSILNKKALELVQKERAH